MDNLSHTLASLVAAELLHRLLPTESIQQDQNTRRRLLLTTTALAGNFPDLDLVLTPLLPEPLGYLLHHRGHTHTVLYALPQALALAAILWLAWPRARQLLKASSLARSGMATGIGIGFGLHLLMDYLNSYGIHPFHPIDSRWFYGDMIFILEPIFWVIFGVPLLAMLRAPFAAAGMLLLTGVLLAFVHKGFLSWWSLILLLGVGAVLAALPRRSQPNASGKLLLPIAASFLLASGFVAVQAVSGRHAAGLLSARLAQADPARRLHDIALTPFPSNPACWMFVSLQSASDGGRYFLTRGVVAILPGTAAGGLCPQAFLENRAFGVDAADAPMLTLSRHQGSLIELKALAASDCHVQAWLRFARMPWIDEGVALDLRYASASRSNFTTMRIEQFEGKTCPNGVPQWRMPREDLLR